MRLLEVEEKVPNWMLDRQTREVGLRGVAVARAVLEQSSRTKVSGFKQDLRKFKLSREVHRQS